MIKTFEQFTKPLSLNESTGNKIYYNDNGKDFTYSEALINLTVDCINSNIELIHELGGKIEFKSPINIDFGKYVTDISKISAVEVMNEDSEGIEDILKENDEHDTSIFVNEDGEFILLTASNNKRYIMSIHTQFSLESFFDLNDKLLEIYDETI